MARQRSRSALWVLAWAAGGLAGFATLAAYLDRFWWVCELFVHFRLTYVLALAALALVFLWGARPRGALAFALLAALNLPPVLPYLRGAPAPDWPAVTLEAVSLNLQMSNDRSDLVEAFLERSAADLVLLVELTAAWQAALAEMQRERYPHRHVLARPDDGFGLALLSRLPLEAARTVYLGDADVPAITARLTVGGRRLRLLGAHLNWPLGRAAAAGRNRQLVGIETFVRASREPVIVLGDLNVSPWSWHYRRLLDRELLTDKPVEPGLYVSWPTWFPPLGIAIDHCLVMPEALAILSRNVGPPVGSDHRPLMVRIGVRSDSR